MTENTSTSVLTFRQARAEDLPRLLELIADDTLGKNREGVGSEDPVYRAAFERIASDANQYLLVAELQQEVIGMLQLTFIPGLSRRGATRALIESVRIASALRSKGYGSELIREAIRIAQERGCSLVQLTSDRQRQQAHRFYTALGFTDSHIGFKLNLTQH